MTTVQCISDYNQVNESTTIHSFSCHYSMIDWFYIPERQLQEISM